MLSPVRLGQTTYRISVGRITSEGDGGLSLVGGLGAMEVERSIARGGPGVGRIGFHVSALRGV